MQNDSAKQPVPTSMPRVLVVGAVLADDSFESHIVESLNGMGCEVAFFATTLYRWASKSLQAALIKVTDALLREPERLSEGALIRRAQQFAPDLVLVVLGSKLSPKTVMQLRRATRAKIVCWCQDQMTTLGRQYLLGAEYDAVFVKDRFMQDLFSRMIDSAPFHYLPEACNPRVHRAATLSEAERAVYACDVMVAGTLYYYRQEILRQLGGFKLKVFGGRPDWLLPRVAGFQGRWVVCDDKARAAAGACISLNTLHYGEVDALNARAFELAGCGAFQLITAVPVLGEHFKVGEELVAFHAARELPEIVRHYLDHPEQAQIIARRGRERAHSCHTYELRLQEIFRVVGLRDMTA